MQEIADEERKRDLADMATIADTAAGRRFLYRILETACVFQPTFSSDALFMSFREGQRNIGLIALNDITEAAPKRYQVMMMEAKERRQARAVKEKAALTERNEGERE